MTEIAHASADGNPVRDEPDPRRESTGPPRRVVTVAILAQAVEYFDFFVFATASAIFLGPLFFSELSGTAATLASFATFAVGFVARPLGGAVAGHYGDKYGRKPVLVASNLLMGVSTFVIGLLPTAAAIGWAAPIILIALRILQGFALGGQWGGASLLLTESSPRSRRGFYGSFVQVGAQLGLIGGLSSYLVLSLAFTDQQMMSWGWRIPFLSGIVMVGIGLYIHRAIEDTPMFRRLQAQRAVTPDRSDATRLCADRPRDQDSLANHSSRRWRIRPAECRRVHHRLGRAELRGPDSRTRPRCRPRRHPRRLRLPLDLYPILRSPQRSVRQATTVSDRCYRCRDMGLADVRPHRHSQPVACVARARRLLHRALDDVRAPSGALRGAFPDRPCATPGHPSGIRLGPCSAVASLHS